MRTISLLFVALLTLSACGSDVENGKPVGTNNSSMDSGVGTGDASKIEDAGADADDSNTTEDASGDASMSEDAAMGDDAGNTGESIRVCQASCQTADDCIVPNSPTYGADNFRCEQNVCVWLGCTSDTECQDDGTGDLCRQTGLAPTPTCVDACTQPSDCAREITTGFDADNYACEDGACIWQGCNDTAECVETFGSAYLCHDEPGFPSSCQLGCDTVADCEGDLSLYDVDNFECIRGACIWQGCNDNTECTDLDPELVCVDLDL